MRLLKKFLLGLFSALFLLSISSAVNAGPVGEDDPTPVPHIGPHQG
ncbi:hypothetical protein KAU13_06740 [candidate division WOR-3 bacterium]|nr:hypothetical protein [candidate division WOR-3 bacterium]